MAAMLPEGAHLRKEDSTVFLLPHPLPADATGDETKTAKGNDRQGDDSAPVATSLPGELQEGEQKEKAKASPGDDGVRAGSPLGPAYNDGEGLFFCFNIVRTKMDSSVRRGAIVKAMAIVTRHRYYHVFQPVLSAALEGFFDATDQDTKETPARGEGAGGDGDDTARTAVLSDLFTCLNALDLSSLPR